MFYLIIIIFVNAILHNNLIFNFIKGKTLEELINEDVEKNNVYEIEKKLDSILIAHYELGIIFEIDVYKRQIIQKKYLR